MSQRRTLQPLCASVSSIALLCALSGCRSFQAPPGITIKVANDAPAGDEARRIERDRPLPLVLLPGDVLELRTASAEQATYPGLLIDAEGKVHIPTAGPVSVSGLAPEEAESKVAEELQKHDRFARVSLLVTSWGGHTATVVGAVANEGQQPVTPNMRVSDLIAACGGLLRADTKTGELSPMADLEAATLMRGGTALPVNLRAALDGDLEHNVLVHPGDQLFLPTGLGTRVAVLGSTRNGSAMLNYRPGLRLTEALAMAGGFTLDSDEEDIRILRGPRAMPHVYQYDFEAFKAGKAGDVELAPGDVVVVGKHWSGKMGGAMSRVAPVLTTMVGLASVGLLIYAIKHD
jgi:protein involved in polysaccharide export with SLBB domain